MVASRLEASLSLGLAVGLTACGRAATHSETSGDASTEGSAEDDGDTQESGTEGGAEELPIPDPHDAEPIDCGAISESPGDATQFVQVGMGGEVACALDNRGSIHCWGTPILDADGLPPPSGTCFTTLAVGAGIACALDGSGQAHCWGKQHGGSRPSLEDVPATSFVSLTAGGNLDGTHFRYVCGLTESGDAHCWGRESNTGIGAGLGSGTWSEISAGMEYSGVTSSGACGIGGDGSIACFYGVVDPPPGAFEWVRVIGSSVCAGTGSGLECAYEGPDTYGAPEELVGAVDMVGGAYHVCALGASGGVTCWGVGEAYEPQVPPDKRFKRIESGQWVICGILDNGELDCFGLAHMDGDPLLAPPNLP